MSRPNHTAICGYARGLAQTSIDVLFDLARVTSVVHLVDPTTMQHAELPAAKFFRAPFSALFTSKELIEFEVLDVELMGPPTGGSTEQVR